MFLKRRLFLFVAVRLLAISKAPRAPPHRARRVKPNREAIKNYKARHSQPGPVAN